MRKVFFVDDEPLIAQGLQSITDWQQFDIHISGTAGDGLLALESLEKEPVDLLITDIMMPRMNGLELIQRVKELNPSTKFIVLSGYEEFDYVKKGISLGIENYILKPINIEELESTIRHIRSDWAREELNMFHLEEDWMVLRSNVLQRWVNGSIESMELKQRAAILGIPVNYTYYQAAVFRLISEEISSQEHFRMNGLAEECAGAVRSVLGKTGEVICFPDADEDIVILFASSEHVPTQIFEQSIQMVAQTIHRGTNLRVWSSGGATVSHSQNVQDSYIAAKSAFLRLLISGEHVAVYTAFHLDETPTFSTTLWSDDQFAKLWIEGQRDAVEQFIETVMEGDSREELLPRQPFVNTAIRLMLATQAKERNTDYHEMMGPLARMNTLKGLKDHVLSVVKQTMSRQGENHEEYSLHVAFMIEQAEEKYKEDLSLKALSQRMGMHPSYLGQLFLQEVGASFSDYVNYYRIEKATQLLLHTEQKTAEIATAVGYLDTSYFYRQFKKYAGVSPTELRNMYPV